MARPSLAVTGTYDDDTVTAVMGLQQYLGMSPTGVFDPTTATALNTALADPNGVSNMLAYNQQIDAQDPSTSSGDQTASGSSSNSSSSGDDYSSTSSGSDSYAADPSSSSTDDGYVDTSTPAAQTVDQNGNPITAPAQQPITHPNTMMVIGGVVLGALGLAFLLRPKKSAPHEEAPAAAPQLGSNYLDEDEEENDEAAQEEFDRRAERDADKFARGEITEEDVPFTDLVEEMDTDEDGNDFVAPKPKRKAPKKGSRKSKKTALDGVEKKSGRKAPKRKASKKTKKS